MATWQDVRDVLDRLPETVEADGPTWKVNGRPVAWARPLRRRDLAELGDAAPAGDVLGVGVGDRDDKERVLAEVPGAFTTGHFDGYAAVLVDLPAADAGDVADLVRDHWVRRAPVRARKQVPWATDGATR